MCGVSVPSLPIISCIHPLLFRVPLHSNIAPLLRFAWQIEDYSLVSFVPLNIRKEESIQLALAHIDHALQYGEDMEPKEPKDEAAGPEE